MGEVPDNDNVGVAARLLDAGAIRLEGVFRRRAAALSLVVFLVGVVGCAQRVEQLAASVPGVQGRDAERGLLEAP